MYHQRQRGGGSKVLDSGSGGGGGDGGDKIVLTIYEWRRRPWMVGSHRWNILNTHAHLTV